MAETSENRAAFWIRNAVIASAGLFGVVLLLRLVFLRGYNYDEIGHAHLTWLVSVGVVPFRDFAANHFPFFWILLSPLMRVLPESPVTLLVLRGLALVLNVVFVGALGVLIVGEQPRSQRIWAVACFGLVAFSPPALHYLIEVRPDPLANALLFSAIAWLWFKGSWNSPKAFVSGFCIGTAVLVNTKCTLFPLVLGVVAVIAHLPQWRRIWRPAFWICVGFGAALLSGLLLLVWMRIPLEEVWRMVVTYNTTVEKAQIYGFGLARAVIRNCSIWLAYIILGLIGCAVMFPQQRRSPGSFAIALLVFLLADFAVTTRPWKQYVVWWLLLGAYFPARSLPFLAARLGGRVQVAVALGVVAIAFLQFRATSMIDPSGGSWQDRSTQDRLIEWGTGHVPRDEFVVASFALHPVFRRDSFFKVMKDMMANGRDGLEQFMPRLAPASYGDHFRQSGYESDLEMRPPTVIIGGGAYSGVQADVLNAYLSLHRDRYDLVTVPGTSVVVAERKPSGPTVGIGK